MKTQYTHDNDAILRTKFAIGTISVWVIKRSNYKCKAHLHIKPHQASDVRYWRLYESWIRCDSEGNNSEREDPCLHTVCLDRHRPAPCWISLDKTQWVCIPVTIKIIVKKTREIKRKVCWTSWSNPRQSK